MKRISDKKLEAFSVGAMGKRPLSKKELEDQRKKEEEAAAAHAFKEFVETFQDTTAPAFKVWVKAGTYDAGSRVEDVRDKGKLYKPSSKRDDLGATEKAQEYAKLLAFDLKKDSTHLKKKSQEKKKSNLELFKEELRQIQEEREERHKYKSLANGQLNQTTLESASDQQEKGSFDTGDPNTTNLYLGNLNPKISEQQLMEIFGRYGPLASIKIMWPRSEEEKQRGRNCGFVAYMSRKDAERALKTLNGRFVMGYEMRLGWGKSVPIMNQPIFVPAPLLELTMPPSSFGLPFNAQPPTSEIQNLPKKHYREYNDEEKQYMIKLLPKCVVKVFIPTEKSVLNLIHRMIEFVIREGPVFEALIMSREIDNPLYSFLFENESPAHLYYRWKLFSLLQGDTPTEWNESEFRMFEGGPIWKPPVANFYTQGMSDDLVVDPDAPEIHKGALSVAQRDRLEDLLRHLTPERGRIGDAMIFCIEHADAADEICECIAESLMNSDTLPSKKIARLYLLSDILHNCTVKVSNASFFRKSIEKQLSEIFDNLHSFYINIDSRLKAEGFKSRVLNVLKAWEEWAVYSKDFISKIQSLFIKKQMQLPISVDEEDENVDDIDGAPLSGEEKDDEDLDGIPLDGAALLKGVLMRGIPDVPLQNDYSIDGSSGRKRQMRDVLDDIDGIPMEEEIDGVPIDFMDANDHFMKTGTRVGSFIPSKWETIDPEKVEAQAVTTSKWDTLDPPKPPSFTSCDDENEKKMSESKSTRSEDDYPKSEESSDVCLSPDLTYCSKIYKRTQHQASLDSSNHSKSRSFSSSSSYQSSSKRSKRKM